MTIWLDGDSIPRDLRALLVRRAQKIGLCFISSKPLTDIPPKLFRLVPGGPDSVDSIIEAEATPEDIVITRDILFAERMAMKGIPVLNDKGDIFTHDNVAERRSLRDKAAELRLLGIAPEMPKGSSRSARDVKRFADSLDRLITKVLQGK